MGKAFGPQQKVDAQSDHGHQGKVHVEVVGHGKGHGKDGDQKSKLELR